MQIIPPIKKVYSNFIKINQMPSVQSKKQIFTEGRKETLREKVQISLKEKFKDSIQRLQKQRKYEQMIDDFLMKHTQAENIPVLTKGLSKKNTYKNYRIVKTQRKETSPKPIDIIVKKSEQMKKRRLVRANNIIRKQETEPDAKIVKQSSLPLIFKYKKSQSVNSSSSQQNQRYGQAKEQQLKSIKNRVIFKYTKQFQSEIGDL